jgi:hypothetical protein
MKLKEGMKIKVREEWSDFIKGKHFVEDIVTILKLTEEKVTFHSDYLGSESITIPIGNFWKGVELIEIINAPLV